MIAYSHGWLWGRERRVSQWIKTDRWVGWGRSAYTDLLGPGQAARGAYGNLSLISRRAFAHASAGSSEHCRMETRKRTHARPASFLLSILTFLSNRHPIVLPQCMSMRRASKDSKSHSTLRRDVGIDAALLQTELRITLQIRNDALHLDEL